MHWSILCNHAFHAKQFFSVKLSWVFHQLLDVDVNVQCGTNSFTPSKVIHLCIFRSTMLIIKVLPVRPVITGKTWMQIDCVNPWNCIPKRFPFFSELQWLILVNASLQINIHWMNIIKKSYHKCVIKSV